MPTRFIIASLAVVCALVGPVMGDEIFFKNGDHLTGKILSADGGKLVIDTAVAGKISVDMKTVKTFTTVAPIEIHLNNGTVIHQAVTSGPDGQFRTAPNGPLAQQNFPIAAIAVVNPPTPKPWSGHVTLTGAVARGNTNSEMVNLIGHVQRSVTDNLLTLDAGYNYQRQAPVGGGPEKRTEDNWFFEAEDKDLFTKKFYGYVDARVERDLLADLSLRLTPGAGLGYYWFNNPKDFTFSTEAGISWVYRSFSNDGTQDSVAARAAYDLVKVINDKVSIFHDFQIFPAFDSIDDFFLITDVGIRAKLTDHLYSEFRIDFRHDQRPAPGAQQDDTLYSAGLGLTF
jgi:putative salt-induced outer membrane protein YdiY